MSGASKHPNPSCLYCGKPVPKVTVTVKTDTKDRPTHVSRDPDSWHGLSYKQDEGGIPVLKICRGPRATDNPFSRADRGFEWSVWLGKWQQDGLFHSGECAKWWGLRMAREMYGARVAQ